MGITFTGTSFHTLPKGNYHIRLKSHDKDLVVGPTYRQDRVDAAIHERGWNPSDVIASRWDPVITPGWFYRDKGDQVRKA